MQLWSVNENTNKTAYDNNLEHVIIAEDDITFIYLDKLNKSS